MDASKNFGKFAKFWKAVITSVGLLALLALPYIIFFIIPLIFMSRHGTAPILVKGAIEIIDVRVEPQKPKFGEKFKLEITYKTSEKFTEKSLNMRVSHPKEFAIVEIRGVLTNRSPLADYDFHTAREDTAFDYIRRVIPASRDRARTVSVVFKAPLSGKFSFHGNLYNRLKSRDGKRYYAYEKFSIDI